MGNTNTISGRKEAQHKPLFNVLATFDIKTCATGLYCASFDIIMSLMMLKCQKLHYYHFIIILFFIHSSFFLPSFRGFI